MKKNTSTTPLEFALLGLLQTASMSGYDLRKIFTSTLLGQYSDSPGAIYPALRRLLKRGLLADKIDRTHALKPRQLYSLSPTGQALLVEWLRQLPTAQQVQQQMPELLLKFAFMEAHISRAERIRFLTAVRDHAETYLQTLMAARKQMEEISGGCRDGHARLCLECGIRSFQTHAQWAAWAIAELGEESR